MATTTQSTIGAIFESRDAAVRAVDELQRAGFDNETIGIVGRDAETGKIRKETSDETQAGEGTATGAAVGAGLGALAGLGVLSGMIPVIGPAIAGGTLGVILSNAAAGAAVAGVAGTLVGLGIPESDADYYHDELKAGRTLVTIAAEGREADAARVLRACGGRTKPLTDRNAP
jgi:hypothetical protein